MQVDPGTLTVPAPVPTSESAPFWRSCAEERFILQHCDSCGRWIFYPRALCPFCWSSELTWLDASGTGVVRSFSVIHKPGHPAWTAAAPYTVAVITLTEGPTMLTTLIDIAPDAVSIGMPVEIAFTPVGEFTLPFFRPQSAQKSTQEVPR